ncbi:GspH/FimT family pseudopilin [Thalassotalea sp. G2M2-11]|uniref:GspH/FimT family pseudopilin n=1 Tax=Thalassotalea sp. G2M2-11 TaxID=2787627 RepID=UPI0019D15E34|nr:GspH/FimT family pseudopilin [Thalassotalea sp. G2M2-11]
MKSNGFTLIEILVSITILMILITVGIPSFDDFIVQMRVDNEISSINRLLNTARVSAISNSLPTTVCPLNDDNQCHNQWHKSISVFIDTNNNKIFEANKGEIILTSKDAIHHQDKLQYGTSRIGLTYGNDGHLNGWGQNATFSYCPHNHLNKSRGVVVHLSGRAYKSKQDKSSGRDKTRSGKYIVCH